MENQISQPQNILRIDDFPSECPNLTSKEEFYNSDFTNSINENRDMVNQTTNDVQQVVRTEVMTAKIT